MSHTPLRCRDYDDPSTIANDLHDAENARRADEPPSSLDEPETNVEDLRTPPPPTLPSHLQQTTDEYLEDHTRFFRGVTPTIADAPVTLPTSVLSLEVTFRHSGWTHDRSRVFSALQRLRARPSTLENFARCGSDAWVWRHAKEPGRFRVTSNYCHHRFCLPCGHLRGSIIAYNLQQQLPGKTLRFITLTIRHSADPLRDQLDRLYDAFRKLRRSKTAGPLFAGGVSILEIKHDGGNHPWHPHLHVISEGSFVEQRELSAEWHRITRDSFVVHVAAVRNVQNTLRYVTKYVSKPLERSVIRSATGLDEAITALHGRRLVWTFGSWRGVKLAEPPDDGEDWIVVGPLTEFLDRADRGDTHACLVVERLRDQQHSRATPRPPPRPVVEQLSFDEVLEL